tara:strand:+ start:8328 stop:8855 length:528 start_codon:yes stop_codon:yes gene_type:complete
MNYYRIVLTIALIFLLIVSTYFWWFFPRYNTIFPPRKATCPDYWIAKYNQDDKEICIPPKNEKNMGKLLDHTKENINYTKYIDDNKIDYLSNDRNTVWNHYTTTGKNNNYKVDFNGIDNIPGYNVENDTENINFNHESWDNDIYSKDCNQKVWSNKYNIEWEGISNFNKKCISSM